MKKIITLVLCMFVLFGCGDSKEEKGKKEKEKVYSVVETLLNFGYKIAETEPQPILIMGGSDGTKRITFYLILYENEKEIEIIMTSGQETYRAIYNLHDDYFEMFSMSPDDDVNICEYGLDESVITDSDYCRQAQNYSTELFHMFINLFEESGITLEDLMLDYDYLEVYNEKNK